MSVDMNFHYKRTRFLPAIPAGLFTYFKFQVILLESFAFLMLFDSESACAFWPPLQDAQVWTTQAGSQTTVHYKIFDPKLDSWQESSWVTSNSVFSITSQNGIVAWGCYSGSPSSGYIYSIIYCVYDPAAEAWKVGSWSQQVNSVYGFVVQGAVVAWGYYWGSPASGYIYGVNYCIYDPAAGVWKMSGWSQSANSVYNLVVQDGVVAWGYYWGSPSSGYTFGVNYCVYDPAAGAWNMGSWSNSQSVSGVTIQNATVYWSAGGYNYTRGYDYNTLSWYDGLTLPCAYFVAAPTSGNPPLWVWFTDMSIGAVNWGWTFGDGGTSIERSSFHTYSTYATFTVVQSVSGAAGSHSASCIIETDFVPPAGSITINGGDVYTDSCSVTLTLSATDNSGSVALMRFSNDNLDWTGWVAYADGNAWTLTNGDGEKTVYVQFEDASGNVSGIYSDTIILDTASSSVTITNPTTNSTYSTANSPLSIGGTASDSIGVTLVVWSNNRGGNGTCSGTTSWSSDGITLYSGHNIITVTAWDAAGNAGTAILTVIYNRSIMLDLNNDGLPDFLDFSIFAAFWQQTSCSLPDWCRGADFDHDGVVGIRDLQIFTEFWLWPVEDMDMDKAVNFTDYALFVNYWKEQSCAEPDWCNGTDFDHSGVVDIFDLGIFVQNWLK
jgi:PKD repeat protein